MCAILDNSCRDEVFGSGDRHEAAKKFLDWLGPKTNLVVGGKLREELNESGAFSRWCQQAINAGWVITIDDKIVNERTEDLLNDNSCKSNDAHVIALAQVSNARLLYSNDGDLNSDFQNSNLIKNPRGKIYSTQLKDRSGTRSKKFGPSHKKLLSDRRLCRN